MGRMVVADWRVSQPVVVALQSECGSLQITPGYCSQQQALPYTTDSYKHVPRLNAEVARYYVSRLTQELPGTSLEFVIYI